MRPVHQLVHSRATLRRRYALFPLDGFPFSRLPSWPEAEVQTLCAPAMGAQFVQYLISLPAGKRGEFVADDRTETFYYVMSGSGQFSNGSGAEKALQPGSFGLTPPGKSVAITAKDDFKLLVHRKRYEPAPGIKMFAGVYGEESKIAKQVWADNPHSLLQTLIPDELDFDMAMNIFTFDPGHGLPLVETHVMEHGLYFLEGKGMYYLDGQWMEVEKDDFIWMGPYCPQSFYATGPTPARYIYYKNVNREIAI
jgi:(S)-ureidoglycine aminohydrolase